MKKKGFTLIELLVVIAIIAMLLAILMPALNKVKKIAQRVVCGTNLKGLGTAQSVYANDYEDQFAKQGGSVVTLNWGRFTGSFDDTARKWTGASTMLTIGASLYLLVREADVSPKSFVCGASGQTAYDGKNPNAADLVELWDFGGRSVVDNQMYGLFPNGHVSYAYHQPYGQNAASGASSASFAVMADKNPWFDSKLKESAAAAVTADDFSGLVARMGDNFSTGSSVERWQIQVANAYAHGREGQNVSFGDGHSEYCKTPDVGVKHDNIYTKQQYPYVNEASIRCGISAPGTYVGPTATTNIASINVNATTPNQHGVSAMDSLLISDDDNLP